MGRFRDLWASGRFMANANSAQPTPADDHPQPSASDAIALGQDIGPEYAISENSRNILAALSTRRGQETGRWLMGLQSEAGTSGAAASSAAGAGAGAAGAGAATGGGGGSAFEEIVALIDSIFKEFAELSFEFNKSAVGTELMVGWEQPELSEKKTDEVWYRPVEKTYSGRLTTRQWAMVVKGSDKKISIYLLPSSMLLAFSFGQDDKASPFMEIVHAGPGQWTIGGENAPMTGIYALAKELLGDLIRVSSGVMSEDELFAPHSAEKPALGQNLAVGFDAAQQQAASHKVRSDIDQMDMHDACDIVDHIIDKELQALYQKAKAAAPGSGDTDSLRKQISAVENFRIKMLDAFEEYTQITTLMAEQAGAQAPAATPTI